MSALFPTWREGAAGLAKPAPPGGIVDLARTVGAQRIGEELAAAGPRIRALPGPRGWSTFVDLAFHRFARRPVFERAALLPPGLGALVAEALASPDADAASSRYLATLLAACTADEGVVLPPQGFDREGRLPLLSRHAVLASADGPVALLGSDITWFDGVTDDHPRAAGRLQRGRWIGDLPLVDGTHLPGGLAGGLRPASEVAPEELESLRASLELFALAWPAAFSAAQRWIQGIALVDDGATWPVDLLAVPVADLGSRVAMVRAMTRSAARQRVALAWPLLCDAGDHLAAEHRRGRSSALADLAAALDEQRLLLHLTAGDAEVEIEPLDPGSWRDALGAELEGPALAAVSAEVEATLGPLERDTEKVRAKAARRREIGVESRPPAPGSANDVFAFPTGDLATLRESFRTGGHVTIGPPTLSPAFFQQLLAESVRQFDRSWASDRDEPPQALQRSELGPWGRLAAEGCRYLLEAVTGAALVLSREASCYSYYVGPQHFIGWHTDRPGACIVTALVYLQAKWPAGTEPGPGLSLLVYDPGAKPGASPRAVVSSAPNRTLALLGSELPHERPRLRPGEAVSLLALCYAVRDA